jgi:Uma2 family endonuclease
MVANIRFATVQDVVVSGADRLELLRGELIEMAPVSLRHFAIVGALQREFGIFVRAHDLGIVGGEGGFVLGRDPDTLLAPDVAFIRKDRLPAQEDWDGFPELVPDLVVEVVSPSDRAIDVYDKTRVYLAAGVSMVLTVWPKNQTVTVDSPRSAPFTLGIHDQFDGGEVLPGFALMISQIFE